MKPGRIIQFFLRETKMIRPKKYKYLLEDINNFPVLSEDEEIKLLGESKGNKAAKDKLISSKLHLVVRIARWHSRIFDCELDELIQEGSIGLMRAVDKFDYQINHEFSAYAKKHIRRAIQRAVLNQIRSIRIPASLSRNIRRYYNFRKKFFQKNNRDPNRKEIANKLKMDFDQIKDIEQFIELRRALPIGNWAKSDKLK